MGMRLSQKIGVPVVTPNYEPWTTVSVTNTLTTNVTTIAKRRIYFDVAEYDINVLFSGANTQGILAITLPANDVMDFSTFTTGSGFESLDPIFSSVNVFDANGTSRYLGRVFVNTSTQVRINITDTPVTAFSAANYATSNTLDTSVNRPITFATGDQITIRFQVPLVRLASAYVAVGAGYSTTGPSLVNGMIPTTNLTAAELTAQTGCVIDSGDIYYCKYNMTNRIVWLGARFDTMSISSATTFSFTLPAAVPRPLFNISGYGLVYDGTGTTGQVSEVQITSGGVVSFSRIVAGSWTAGTNTCTTRFQLQWPTT